MYKIIRVNDNKEFMSESFKFVEFDELGFGTKMIDNIKINTSLILPPYNMLTMWMTSPITEIIQNNSDSIHFKTKNSEYFISLHQDL